MMESTRTYYNQRSLAFIVLITGIVGGLLIVFSILLLCKYCVNRKNLREAEQMKLLYETLNQASLLDSNRIYRRGIQDISRLEPRRSNPLDRYQLSEYQWQIPSSKRASLDVRTSAVQETYNQTYHENREQNGNKPHDSNTSNDDEPAEQYLQVDPRCYVRQNSNTSVTTQRRPETPRLEKGYTISIDTRPSPTSSLSPYRQSSFDVALAYHTPNQQSLTPSPAVSTQQDIYFTPRGSSLSVVGNPSTNTPPGSQHLLPPTSKINKKPSTIEKKDLTVKLNPSDRISTIRPSIAQREHEHSRSLENSTSSNNSTVDKQSHSFDAANLLLPDSHHKDGIVNRRTKSYEYAEEHHSSSPVAPLPIIIKIPDMSELVQAAQLSQLDEYQQDDNRNGTLAHQIIINNETTSSKDRWRSRQAYELEQEQQQQQLDQTSPEDLSPDLFTSTSIDSAGAIVTHHSSKKTNGGGGLDNDLSNYQYRRKSSSNLLLPPPEVRRQALRRTFEKRRNCINQSNARREQQEQLNNNQPGLDDDYNTSTISSTIKSTDFSSLLNNFNSKSENSSFDRSLETDFDMQSDTSSRGQNDHFTSIESSGNENALPDVNNHHLLINRPQRQPSHQDDSGYKSLESQNSQNHTFSLDWMSADGGESVIYLGESRIQPYQRRVDLEEDPIEQQISNNNRINSKIHHINQETSIRLNPLAHSNSHIMQQHSLSTNISLDDRYTINSTNLLSSPSFNRSASKKRREFSKDKRHAASSATLPHIMATDGYEINTKQTSSTLQVRHPDLRRSKSDEAEIIDSLTKRSTIHSNEYDNNTYLSSSADGLLHSAPSPNTIRPNNTGNSRHIFQKSPSVIVSPQVEAFRSKRGAMSFDNQTPPINSSQTNARQLSTISQVLPTSGTKPRLKFSMVRDTTTTSLGSASSNYTMPLMNDYRIDEKTNRIINEFLMQDDNNKMNDDVPYRKSLQPIRQKTFDETVKMNNNNIPKQARAAFIKQRPHSFVQTNIRQYIPPRHPSLHLADSIEQNEDNSDSIWPPSKLTQQSVAVVRQDNGITVGSPSIIVTGYDSGS